MIIRDILPSVRGYVLLTRIRPKYALYYFRHLYYGVITFSRVAETFTDGCIFMQNYERSVVFKKKMSIRNSMLQDYLNSLKARKNFMARRYYGITGTHDLWRVSYVEFVFLPLCEFTE